MRCQAGAGWGLPLPLGSPSSHASSYSPSDPLQRGVRPSCPGPSSSTGKCPDPAGHAPPTGLSFSEGPASLQPQLTGHLPHEACQSSGCPSSCTSVPMAFACFSPPPAPAPGLGAPLLPGTVSASSPCAWWHLAHGWHPVKLLCVEREVAPGLPCPRGVLCPAVTVATCQP